MMNRTGELETEEGLEATTQGALRVRIAVTRFLETIARFVEVRPWIFLAILLLPYVAYLATHRPPLWHDELFTYYIAQAPTFGQMIQETRTLDLNPPLSYILVRGVFKFLHPSSFATRLPSMTAFFAAAVVLYVFVRRRSSPIYGALGALVLLGSTYKSYSIEARPYALVLCFLGVAAIGWQLAAEKQTGKRWPGLLLLVLGGVGMLSSHVLATVAYGAFFVAELVRLVERRKPDWLMWIALLAPLKSTVLYKPLLQSHGAGAFPSEFQASLGRLIQTDGPFWTALVTLLAITLVAIIVIQGGEFSSRDYGPRRSFSAAEVAFAVYLLLLPLIVTGLFMRSHSAYFERYGMPSVFGAGILVPCLIASWTRRNRVAGLLSVVVFSFGVVSPAAFIKYGGRWIHPPQAANDEVEGISNTPLDQIEPGLPFVDASGLTFLEMNSREDRGFLSRVYYLTDQQAAIQYSHATIFEGFPTLKQYFPIQANVEPYQEFIRAHHRFLVYGTYDYPEDWLLRKLMADGAIVRFLGDFPAGYREGTLYEVTVP